PCATIRRRRRWPRWWGWARASERSPDSARAAVSERERASAAGCTTPLGRARPAPRRPGKRLYFLTSASRISFRYVSDGGTGGGGGARLFAKRLKGRMMKK